jgi:hypothetical protein
MNPYLEGSLEWHAWNYGAEYQALTGEYRDAPLSGEWAGDLTPADVIRDAWRHVMGLNFDTYEDGGDEDRDYDESIITAWEAGYYSL